MKIVKRMLKTAVAHWRTTAGLFVLAAVLTGAAFVSYVGSPVNHSTTPKIV
ncbi:MAG: hypothetical protein IH628_11510, partial [Proteobacteria bacterium]|nr:hypothetical protein [Pseudomonadota bacterium]